MAHSIERDLSPSRARERDLVLAFQAGDAAAYDSIDHSCRPAAERICRRLLVNHADVEEAVQETMVRAYQGLPRFNGSYALTAWIARIATNVCLDTIRARSRRPQNGGTIEPNMEPHSSDGNGHHLDPEELVEKVFEAEDVRSVLSALPERHRTALVLREFEGYSHRQIASMLDTSPQRVKALIHRAKAGFRRAWSDDHHPGRLAAFAPLLTPINWMRRLVGRAPEFDYSATTSAATTVAATPVGQSLVTIAAERASVLATVMLAGTMGLAIQHAPSESRVEEQPLIVEAAQAPVEVRDSKSVAQESEKKREEPKPEASPSPTVGPSPATEELEEVVLDEPEEAGKPEVVTSPSPASTPHPAGFTYSFTSDRTADEPCTCGGAPQLTQKSISVSEDGMASFEGSLSDAISDSTGKAAWAVEIDLRTDSENLQMYFELRDADGVSPYDASGVRGTTNAESWGGWTYTYTGSYQRRAGPSEHADAPHRGTFTAALTFSWAEQRLVSATFGLNEAA